jgi:hypothetical protein
VQALSAGGYQVYAVNPLAVARYRDRDRDRHQVSGAKFDAGDAKLLADLVRTDRHNHRPLSGDSAQAEAIMVLARGHQNLRCRPACLSASGPCQAQVRGLVGAGSAPQNGQGITVCQVVERLQGCWVVLAQGRAQHFTLVDE